MEDLDVGFVEDEVLDLVAERGVAEPVHFVVEADEADFLPVDVCGRRSGKGSWADEAIAEEGCERVVTGIDEGAWCHSISWFIWCIVFGDGDGVLSVFIVVAIEETDLSSLLLVDAKLPDARADLEREAHEVVKGHVLSFLSKMFGAER